MIITAFRFVLVWCLMTLVSPVVFFVLVLLLPSRIARIKWLNRCGARVSPILFWILGVRVQRSVSELASLEGPAIYVANHSSALDTVLVPWFGLISATFVAKKEALFIPILGQVLWLSGHVFIDRSNPVRAVHSLNELADFVKANDLSVWIMPEGTRSMDGTLGRFKSGFAHLAVRTGYPIVPVAIHGASTVWPNGTWTLKNGEVCMRALTPISTTHWTGANLRQQVSQVRSKIQAELERT